MTVNEFKYGIILVITVNPLGDLKHGEYTGFSHITGKHYVSFYDGSTKSFSNTNKIKFI